MSDEAGGELVELKSMRMAKPKDEKRLANYYMKSYPDGKRIVEMFFGYNAPTIKESMAKVVSQMPNQLNGKLFVVVDDTFVVMRTPSDLFGWISGEGIYIDWSDSAECAVNKSEFFAYLLQCSPAYRLIAKYPHYPKMPDVYYMKDIPPENNGTLDALCDFFTTVEPSGRDFIKSAFMTLFWGGPGGARPGILITGGDHDEESNKGIGKSTLSEIASDLCGGSIDLSKRIDGEELKKRVLTAESERVVRFDNIKEAKFSSDDVESLITSKYISGHLMYAGNKRIPNIYTYMLTFNDPKMSKDMAQRSCVIRLARPVHSEEWVSRQQAFLSENQERIIADIGFHLTKPSSGIPAVTRWATWEKNVLTKASSNPEIAKEMKAAQVKVDDDADLKVELLDAIQGVLAQYFFTTKFSGEPLYLDPTEHYFGITSKVLQEWTRELIHERLLPRAFIKKMVTLLGSFFPGKSYRSHGGRYFLFNAKNRVSIRVSNCVYLIRSSSPCHINEHGAQNLDEFI